MPVWHGKTKKDVQVGSGPRLSQEVATNNVTPASEVIDVEQEEERNRMVDEVRK